MRLGIVLILSLPMAACFTQSAATLDALGVVLSPYLGFSESDDPTAGVVIASNQSRFVIQGECSVPGGAVQIIEPEAFKRSGTCTSEGSWSFELDFSSQPDGVFEFTVRHSRADGARSSDRETTIYKITQVPPVISGIDPSQAVNPSQLSGNTVVVSWPQGYDSSGSPLMNYEVSVSSSTGAQGSLYQQWTSVGTSTSTEVTIPGSVQTEGGIFYVNIRGTDRIGQTTSTQTQSFELDSMAPVFTQALSASASSSNSTSVGPAFSWGVSDPSTSGSGSGIEVIQYRITTQSGAVTTRNWTNLAASDSTITPSGLVLTPGQYYQFEIRARDFAGNESTPQTGSWYVNAPTLAFTSVPSSGYTNTNLSVSARFEDGRGGVLSSETATVQLAAFSDASCSISAAGAVSGSSMSAVSGVANFTALRSDTAGTIYLKGTAAGYPVACSSAITLSAMTCPSAFLAANANATAPVAGSPCGMYSENFDSSTTYAQQFTFGTSGSPLPTFSAAGYNASTGAKYGKCVSAANQNGCYQILKTTLGFPIVIEFDLNFLSTYYTGTYAGLGIYEGTLAQRETNYGYPYTGTNLGRITWADSYYSSCSGQMSYGTGIFSSYGCVNGVSKKVTFKLEMNADRTFRVTQIDRGVSPNVTTTRTGSVPINMGDYKLEFIQSNYSTGMETQIDNIKIYYPAP